MADAVGNDAKQFTPEAGMAAVPENDETETTGRNFGNERLRGVATAITGIHLKTLLGSRSIDPSAKDGLEEFPSPYFLLSGFPCPVAANDMRFRADMLCQRERVSECCIRGVRAVVSDKRFAI